MAKEWDVFVSHASEDKEIFVRPLAQALDQLGRSSRGIVISISTMSVPILCQALCFLAFSLSRTSGRSSYTEAQFGLNP
jgi:hypothetical protein